MKQSVRLGMILGVALAALSACSTDKANDPLASTTEGPQAIHEVPIKLSMEAEFDDEALRAMNFQLDAQNRPRVKLAGTTVPVHCVIRSDNAADPPTFVTLNFKVTGTNALKLEMTDVSLNSESNFIPTAGRRWYIMGIIGGTPVIDPGTGKPNGQVKFDSSSQPLQRVAIGSEGTSDVPYLSNWVELDLRSKVGSAAYHGGATGRLTFQPQGTLLRIQLRNNLPISHIQVHKLRTTSKVVDSKGYFNLNIPTTTTTAPWAYAEAMPATGYSRLYELSAPTLDMPAQTADNAYYLLWVMPNGSTTTGAAALTFLYTVRDRVAERLVGDGVMKLSESLASNYGTSKAIRPHASYLVRPTVDANWNPLNQMSPSNIISTVPGVFSNSFGNLEHQLYTINEATLIAVHHSTLSGGVWHLPSPEEWRTVIGDAGLQLPNHPTQGVFSKVERVQYGRVVADVTSTYATYLNHSMAFGVRFQTTTSNPSYTAWRYEAIANPHSTGYAYVIKSRYLGPGAHETIHNTALESWWNAPVPAGAEAVRYIPLPGRKSNSASDPTVGAGFRGYYWTNHSPIWPRFTVVFASYPYPSSGIQSGDLQFFPSPQDGNTNWFAVRLFRLP